VFEPFANSPIYSADCPEIDKLRSHTEAAQSNYHKKEINGMYSAGFFEEL
jgi:hypothetical protein